MLKSGTRRAGVAVRPKKSSPHSREKLGTVAEKAERVAVLPVDIGWSDVGSWDAVHALGPHDDNGNLLSGDVVAPDSASPVDAAAAIARSCRNARLVVEAVRVLAASLLKGDPDALHVMVQGTKTKLQEFVPGKRSK